MEARAQLLRRVNNSNQLDSILIFLVDWGEKWVQDAYHPT